jgi:hypothetical protein
MAYFTLVSRDPIAELNGLPNQWVIEFGDYERETVEYERDDYRDRGYRTADLKIIRTADARQTTINAAVAQLNARYTPRQCRHCYNPPMPGYGNCLSCAEEVGGDF